MLRLKQALRFLFSGAHFYLAGWKNNLILARSYRVKKEILRPHLSYM